jgi:DNA-binding transcriptional LysR family regulator
MNESLDSRQLHAFVFLARTGSHTETAKQLYVTHSAISHSIRNLEEQVGCRLFHKLGKKVMLTEAGEALRLYAERALSEMQQARIALADLNQWGSRRLRLAVEAIFPPDFLTAVLLKFRHEFPRAAIQVETCPPGQAASLLENRAMDLILAAKPPANENIEFRPLLSDRFHCLVNADHPLAAAAKISRAEFAAQPCILLRGCGHERKALETQLLQRDIALNVAAEVDNLETVKSFVKQTPLVSLLPGWVIAPELKSRSLVSLSFSRKPIEQSWGLLHARARPLNHAESMLWKFCGQQLVSLA